MLGKWSDGIMEDWNAGVLKRILCYFESFNIPLFHHSIIPLFQPSIVPFLQYSNNK